MKAQKSVYALLSDLERDRGTVMSTSFSRQNPQHHGWLAAKSGSGATSTFCPLASAQLKL
jgi:hypothetical protein